ncbi:hypothetical protein Droror1_Dr00006226 [Drosera rotundifolia]
MFLKLHIEAWNHSSFDNSTKKSKTQPHFQAHIAGPAKKSTMCSQQAQQHHRQPISSRQPINRTREKISTTRFVSNKEGFSGRKERIKSQLAEKEDSCQRFATIFEEDRIC